MTDTLLTFPCEFTIKVFGLAGDAFKTAVSRILQAQLPDLPSEAITAKSSKNDKYLVLSITIQATSKAQLDRIYQALSAAPEVLMTL